VVAAWRNAEIKETILSATLICGIRVINRDRRL